MIRLNTALIDAIVERRFAGQRWNLIESMNDRRASGSYRASFQRWMATQKLPGSRNAFLHLASALNVDPFCLIELSDGEEPKTLRALHRSVTTQAGLNGALSILHDFFPLHFSWPPDGVAQPYYDRPWCVRSFEHDLRRGTNFYQTMCIAADVGESREAPDARAYHFAYNHRGPLGASMWIEYGVVLVDTSMARLVHTSGYFAKAPYEETKSSLQVQTWFGNSPAKFKIACLHPFFIELADQESKAQTPFHFPA